MPRISELSLSSWLFWGFCVLFCGGALPGAAQADAPPPPKPSQELLADPVSCAWEWRSFGGVGVWAQRCALSTGLWALRAESTLPGFSLTVNDADAVTVLQVFSWDPKQGMAGLTTALRRSGAAPRDGECVLEPMAGRPEAGAIAFLELRPIGARLKAFEATPRGEVPAPPCGEYGWSTHGVRYFFTDKRRPGRALYVNTGQDGMMFDASSARLE